jgi:glycosyltransferase involved in cell wall biosynthesis
MTEKLFVTICEYTIGVVVVVALITILLASRYDFRLRLVKKRVQRTSNKLTKSRQPFITVVVYTHNNASSIERCLDSITHSRYANYRIVIADHKSTDKTPQIVKAYQNSHSKYSLVLYNARDTLSRKEVIDRAIKKLPATDYTMVIEGTVEITDTTLRTAIANFTINDSLNALVLRQYSDSDLSIQNLVPQFASLTKNIIYKALATIRLLPSTESGVSIVKETTNTGQRHYASSVTYHQDNVLSQPKSSIIHLLLKILVCAIVISLIGYWMWTAATLKSNLLLTLSWIVLSISLLAIIWSDNLVKISRKIELTVTVPFMYFFLYAHAFGSFLNSLWLLIRHYPYQKQMNAFKAELYSTRY